MFLIWYVFYILKEQTMSWKENRVNHALGLTKGHKGGDCKDCEFGAGSKPPALVLRFASQGVFT